MYKIAIASFFLFSVLSLTVDPAAAQNSSGIGTKIIDNLNLTGGAAEFSQEQRDTPVQTIAVNIINTTLTLFGIIFLILIIYGGWLWMTAAGNQDHVDRAKKVIQWAAIGIGIVLFSLVTSNFIADTLLRATGSVNGLAL